MKTAVITGASSGIGREFALLADRLGIYDEIWLIARRGERLQTLADSIGTKTKLLLLDLTEPESFAQYKKKLQESNADIALLVNSAGRGKFGTLPMQTEQEIDMMIRLNITATVMMCRHSLPYMHSGAKIINMASVSGSIPLPGLNVYAATKAFVRNFTVALHAELKPLGITATAVCPYWMNTEFISNARDTHASDTVNNFMLIYEPAPVAAGALQAAFADKSELVYGAAGKIMVSLANLLPTDLAVRVWNRFRRREVKF